MQRGLYYALRRWWFTKFPRIGDHVMRYGSSDDMGTVIGYDKLTNMVNVEWEWVDPHADRLIEHEWLPVQLVYWVPRHAL